MEFYIELRKDDNYITSEKIEAKSAEEAKEIFKGMFEYKVFEKAE